MWADNAQRDRIFEMIGTDSVRFHVVRNARLDLQRRLVSVLLIAAAGAWIVIELTR
jgi:hypothetical protein